MPKILQARLQHYVNCELPDVQAGFRKDRGTRDQTANICWIIKKAREFQKNISFCFIDYAKAFDCVDHKTVENSSRDGNTRPPDLPPEKFVCRSGSNSYNWTWNNRLVPNRKRSTSRLCSHPAYITYMQNSVQFSSATQSCPTLCNPIDSSMPGFPVHHQLPELAQTHVHSVG